jgi:hypothetical protein
MGNPLLLPSRHFYDTGTCRYQPAGLIEVDFTNGHDLELTTHKVKCLWILGALGSFLVEPSPGAAHTYQLLTSKTATYIESWHCAESNP